MAEKANSNQEQNSNNIISKQLILPKDFRKPAQIYQILKERHSNSPIFLNRTLNYMENRMSRKKENKRANFKVSTLLSTCIKRMQSETSDVCLQIDFIGYFIYLSPIADNKSTTWLNATLFKILKSAPSGRKSDAQEILRFTTKIALNPYENDESVGSIRIPLNVFKTTDEPNVNYKLLFSLETTRQTDECKTMLFKLRTLSRIYKGEFSVLSKSCNIKAEGYYEVKMRETSMAAKDNLNDVLENKFYNGIKVNPKLKFHLSWLQQSDAQRKFVNCKNFLPMNINDLNNNITANTVPKNVKIIYNFLDRNNKRHSQLNLELKELICLWCSLKCLHLNALLKHLELCHQRLHHNYKSTRNGAHIEISIKNSYNVAVEFSKVARQGNLKQTELLVYHKRQNKISSKNFLIENQKIKQRQFFHANTLLPIHPNELSTDSEAECTPNFLIQRMFNMLDKETVIAQRDEKSLMKLWNMHIMKQRYVDQRHIFFLCENFIDNFGLEIVRQNLYNAFILHLGNLFEQNILTATEVWSSISKIQEILAVQQTTTENISTLADLTQLQNSNNMQPTTSNSLKKERRTMLDIKTETVSVKLKRLKPKIKLNVPFKKLQAKTLTTLENKINLRNLKKKSKNMKPTRRSTRLLAITKYE